MRTRRNQHQTAESMPTVSVGRSVSWDQILTLLIVFVLIAAVAAAHHKRNFTTIASRETADVAQVARNLAEGRGFVTRVVRPFNATLIDTRERLLPELNNGPLYPLILALSFHIQGISDQAVARTSLLLLILSGAAAFALGRTLFDVRVGLLAATVVTLSAPMLQLAGGGQHWILGALLFTTSLTFLARYRVCSCGSERLGILWLSSAAVTTAALYYFSYPCALLTLPAAGYIALVGERRWFGSLLFLVIVALLAAPGVYRNYSLTGSPVLGINTWDLMSDTAAFPGDTLYRTTDRSLHSFSRVLLFPFNHFSAFSRKLASGSIQSVENLLPMLGWLALPFAVTGTLYTFKEKTANSIRGLLYVFSAITVGMTAIYTSDKTAVVILAPAIAVYASAYFLLLVRSRKMPEEFRNWLTGGFVFLTAAPALAAVLWPGLTQQAPAQLAADKFFADNSANVAPGSVLYTDVPWAASWRTLTTAVWLPLSDEDVVALQAAGFPMLAIILTPESASYSESEAWHMLHEVRLWREYVRDPEAGEAEIVAAAGLSGEAAEKAARSLQRFRRGFKVSESVAGFQAQTLDPLASEDIQVLTAPQDR